MPCSIVEMHNSVYGQALVNDIVNLADRHRGSEFGSSRRVRVYAKLHIEWRSDLDVPPYVMGDGVSMESPTVSCYLSSCWNTHSIGVSEKTMLSQEI